jgi:hypothetical protein
MCVVWGSKGKDPEGSAARKLDTWILQGPVHLPRMLSLHFQEA